MKVTEKIKNYAELSVEERLKALEELELEENPNEKHYKELISKANGEASEWKKKYTATLDENQRKEAEIKEEQERTKAELLEYKEKERVSNYASKLISLGFEEEVARESAKCLPEGIGDNFWATLNNNKSEFEKKIRADNIKSMPRPSGMFTGATAKTKDDILKIKDTVERQKAIAENPNLFGLDN